MVDMVNGLADAIDHAHVQNAVVVFSEVVLFGGGFEDAPRGKAGLENLAGGLVGAQFHPPGLEPPANEGQERGRDGAIDEQGFHRVAHGGPLAFGVEGDFLRHFQVGVRIDKHVADTLEMFDDRHFGNFRHGADQPLAAPRHAQIDILCQR